ncbi:hypothetical protein E2562_015705, partial [Oryza meyeriana var. granulata]
LQKHHRVQGPSRLHQAYGCPSRPRHQWGCLQSPRRRRLLCRPSRQPGVVLRRDLDRLAGNSSSPR